MTPDAKARLQRITADTRMDVVERLAQELITAIEHHALSDLTIRETLAALALVSESVIATGEAKVAHG